MIESIAIIPARGGSKGVVRKNLQTVGDISLVARAIGCARKAGINRIIVSTDDSEIATEVRLHGAEVVFRPKDISGDLASSEQALFHVLANLQDYQCLEHLNVAFLQATSPFTHSEDLKAALSLVSDKNSVFAATPFHSFLWKQSDLGWTAVGHDGKSRVMRQQLPPIVVETGNFYCFNAKEFLTSQSRFCGTPIPFQVKHFTAFQIDSEADLEFARKLHLIPGLH